MHKFAKILSYVFDGSVISIPILIIICLSIESDVIKALGWAFLCLTFTMIIPYLYVYILNRKKLIDDLHIPNRENRIKPLIITAVSNIIGFIILYILEAHLFLKTMFLAAIISTITIGIITYFWKISIHTAWMTFIIITFIILFGKWMMVLIPLIPVIGWSRVKIKRHTITQVITGSVITSSTTFFVFYHYGFISFV